jgi:hypothetical protein
LGRVDIFISILNERIYWASKASIAYCKEHFAHYYSFTILPLVITLIVADDYGYELMQAFVPQEWLYYFPEPYK